MFVYFYFIWTYTRWRPSTTSFKCPTFGKHLSLFLSLNMNDLIKQQVVFSGYKTYIDVLLKKWEEWAYLYVCLYFWSLFKLFSFHVWHPKLTWAWASVLWWSILLKRKNAICGGVKEGLSSMNLTMWSAEITITNPGRSGQWSTYSNWITHP